MLPEESLLVCMNGTVRGGASINGAERCESRLVGASVGAIDIDDLFLLCLEVRLSSSGFISGGSFEIFRKTTARKSDKINEAR